jgi:hypothetical protein
VRFADTRVALEWCGGELHPKLIDLVWPEFDEMAGTFIWSPLVTCVWRSPDEDKAVDGTGIHSAWRAVDVRTKDIQKEIVEAVTDALNRLFIYDPNRPSLPVAYSKPHGTGPHLHLQVCDATTRRLA